MDHHNCNAATVRQLDILELLALEAKAQAAGLKGTAEMLARERNRRKERVA